MPVAFDLDPHVRVVRSRAWDAVTEDELARHALHMRDLFASGTIDDRWAQLADFSGCTNLERITTAVIQRLARDHPWPPHVLRVFIAPQELVFGLVRMYQLLTDLQHIHVVRTMAEAQAWLVTQGHPMDAG